MERSLSVLSLRRKARRKQAGLGFVEIELLCLQPSSPQLAPPGLFKKIRDTKGTFHAKMGTIKDRNGMDLTEAENIKKSWREYTEELYKKDLNDPDNHNGVITHLDSPSQASTIHEQGISRFRKGRGTRDQIENIHWIIEKARECQKKTSTSASLTMLKPLTVWITTKCGKFLKRWEYQTTLPAS